MLHKISGRVGHASPSARRTDAATLVRELNDARAPTVWAVHANEPVLGHTAVEVVAKGTFDADRNWMTRSLRFGEEAFEFCRDYPVEDVILRSSADVGFMQRSRRLRRHAADHHQP